MRAEFVDPVLGNTFGPHPEEPERSEGVSKDGHKHMRRRCAPSLG